MAEPCLDCPSVVALVGEGVAAGVAEHVRVNLQFERSGICGPFHHPGEAGRGELNRDRRARRKPRPKAPRPPAPAKPLGKEGEG
jgi:hypothetical protein